MAEREIEQRKDNLHQPIYSNGLFKVGHVSGYPIPGLYATEPEEFRGSFADLDDKDVKVLANIQRRLRTVLKSELDVPLCGLYVEEQPNKNLVSYTMPFHIDRLSEQFSVQVYQPHIKDYLKSYTSSTDQQIQQFDIAIRESLENSDSEIENIPIGLAADLVEKSPEILEAIEVYDESELPSPPQGKKYYVCIGGSKNFQCFLIKDNMSKGEFISYYEEELDDCLKPVYADNHIVVRQDAKYAIPGFYIVSPRKHYTRIDETPKDIFERSMLKVRDVRRGLSVLGINQAYVYHDEKYNSLASVHFWALPIYKQQADRHKLNPTIFSRDI